MQKERITYTSPLDALIAASKQLSVYEQRYQMNSEQFIAHYQMGMLDDKTDFVEWANAYQHFVSVYQQIDKCL